ncbi:MAG: Arm DNA-binding domain-containing protein, partial [Pseudomonadota bacterium]
MPKLTKRFIDRHTSPAPDGDLFFWDEQLPGFGLRVKPSGRKTYILQFRNKSGRSRRMTLGVHGRLTPDQARLKAKDQLGEVEHGGDPA